MIFERAGSTRTLKNHYTYRTTQHHNPAVLGRKMLLHRRAKIARFWLLSRVIGLGGWCAIATGNPTLAQIIPDGTLGNEASVVQSNVNVRGLPAELIAGGAQRNSTLFHSFQQFNVSEGQRTYFGNPAGIENILTRVTGNTRSDILGTLGVNGGANLFLLNPNGILFGPNSHLDIAGSFVASTANSFVFPDGSEFSATNPQSPPLLAINLTPGVQYGAVSPGSTLASTGHLAVGKDLTLVADQLDLQGQIYAGGKATLRATDRLRIRDSAAAPFIAAAQGELLVQGDRSVDIFALNHPDSGFFSGEDMVLRSANPVIGDAHYWSGGNFHVEQLSGNLGDLNSPNDPIIRALGDVNFNTYFGTSLHIFAGGAVNIGSAIITGTETGTAGIDFIQETVQLSNGNSLAIDGSIQPTLDIRAGIDPAQIGTPGIASLNFPIDSFFPGSPTLTGAPTSADISIGTVSLRGIPNGRIFLTNQYKANPSLTGGDISITGSGLSTVGFGGSGGSVLLDSRKGIILDGIDIISFSFGGNGGDVTLFAQEDITLTAGSRINADGLLGGGITFNSKADIFIEDSEVRTRSSASGLPSPIPRSGDINIQSRSLFVTDGGFLTSVTLGDAAAGRVIINARETALFAGESSSGRLSGASSRVGSSSAGDAGAIEIETGSLFVTDGAFLSTRTLGQGDAGKIFINARDAIVFDGESNSGAPSAAFSQVVFDASGDSEGIEINTGSLFVRNGAVLDARTLVQGNAGRIIINARDIVVFDGERSNGNPSGVASFVGAGATGNSGGIEINTGFLSVTNGAGFDARTLGQGNSGKIVIRARHDIVFDGIRSNGNPSSASSQVEIPEARGNAGGIDIATGGSLFVTGGAVLDANTNGQGNAGPIRIIAGETVVFDGLRSGTPEERARSINVVSSGASSAVESEGMGNAGGIEIRTGSLFVTGGASVDARTAGFGDAGTININASDIVLFSGTGTVNRGEERQVVASTAVSRVDPGAIGNAGGISITTGLLSLEAGAQVLAETSGQGNAGNIFLQAANVDLRSGSSISTAVNAGAIGQGGIINLTTRFLNLDRAQILSNTLGQGNAGNITLQAFQTDLRSGSAISSAVSAGAVGQGGTVNLQTTSLLLDSGAQIRADTFGQGNAGNIFLRTSQTNLRFGSAISSAVNAGAIGQGGTVDLTADFLNLNQARILSSTEGQGDAGRINLGATQSIVLANGSTIASTAGTGISGNGGSIALQAPVLLLLDGSQISVSTEGLSDSNAGQISLQGDRVALQDGSQLAATTAGGISGGIGVNARILEIFSGGQIRTTTSGNSAAGDIVLQVLDSITLDGDDSGLFANTVSGSSGVGGSIFIDPRMMAIRNGAGIVVDSQGSGTGGNIQLQAGSLTLDDRARISAITASSQGGNIDLLIDGILLLRRNSSISATAGIAGAGGDGGNIDIRALFVVAPQTENSDIKANAFAGRGGNISFTTNGIFGLQFRQQLTPFSDITVSSQFGVDGTVVFNTPDVDPSRGLAVFPDFVDPPAAIATGCSSGKAATGSLQTSGSGGVPANPLETFSIGSVLPDGIWIFPDSDIERHRKAIRATPHRNPPMASKRPAQGMAIDVNGDMWLTATAAPQGSLFAQPACRQYRFARHVF